MYHFFVHMSQIMEHEVVIQGDDVNHIKNVLRMEPGEEIMISGGEGVDYRCRIKELTEDTIGCEILEQMTSQSELPVELVLYQALPKADKMELIIQKAVELGAARIVPVKTKRCVVKLDDGKKAAKKLARWQVIAETAAKQSGRGIIPEVAPVMALKEAVQEAQKMGGMVIPYEKAEGMKQSLVDMRACINEEAVGIFIGPEGGFEVDEVEYVKEQGGKAVSLGKRILRTETAGFTILSYLMLLIEERNS